MMDRKKKRELPKMQVGFIDFICLPLYQVLTHTHTHTQTTNGANVSSFPQPLADLLEGLVPLLDGVQKNRQEWQNLADNPGNILYYTSVHHTYCAWYEMC